MICGGDESERSPLLCVREARDGIAHVEGLPSAMTNELLEFEDGTRGIALNLDVRDIGVVVLGDFAGMNEVYARHVGHKPPARATIEVSALPSGAKVEIEAIATV